MDSINYKLEKLNTIKPVILHLSQIVEVCNDQVNFTDALRDILGDPSSMVTSFYSFEKSYDLDVDVEIQKLIRKIYLKHHEEKNKEQITETQYILKNYKVNHEEKVTLVWCRIDNSVEETIIDMYKKDDRWKDYNIYQFSDEETPRKKATNTRVSHKKTLKEMEMRRFLNED